LRRWDRRVHGRFQAPGFAAPCVATRRWRNAALMRQAQHQHRPIAAAYGASYTKGGADMMRLIPKAVQRCATRPVTRKHPFLSLVVNEYRRR
jgi:hypothetical protein